MGSIRLREKWIKFIKFNLQIKINTNLVFTHFEYNNFRNHLPHYESTLPTPLHPIPRPRKLPHNVTNA